MFRETIERIRNYFYEYPGNPIELNETELNVKSLMPSKSEVVDKGIEPITTKELRERAEEKFGMRKDTARKTAYRLKKLGLAEKVSKKEWAETGRLEKLSEDRLKSLFVFMAVAFLLLSIVASNPWPMYFAAVLLAVSFLIFK